MLKAQPKNVKQINLCHSIIHISVNFTPWVYSGMFPYIPEYFQ